MSVRPASGGDLSRAELEALAAPLGVGRRTLELWTSQGLMSPAVRTGHGRGKGVEFRWPAVVARQLEGLAGARKYTHSWVGLRHWMWWDGLPIEWERWRADRMWELAGFARAGKMVRSMRESERQREEPGLVRYWADRRPRPAQLSELWAASTTAREAAAMWVLDLMAGKELPDDLTAPFGDGRTVGDVIDVIFGVQRLREREVLVPGGPGEFAAEWLPAWPSPAECAHGFALLTESEAVQLRDRVKRLERDNGGRLYLPHRSLYLASELAAISLPLMAWMIAMKAQGCRSSA